MSFELQILVLGAEGTGKTLLLKRIQNLIQDVSDEPQGFDTVPSTVPTIGTNIVTAVFNRKKFNFRELGGAMAPIWKNYFNESNAVIFMVDTTNNFQVSAATVLFMDVLNSDNLADLPILLVYNKMDLHSSLTVQELKFIQRIDDLQQQTSQKLKIVECSLKTGAGLGAVRDWVMGI
eukprot:Seg1389.12 transcript_id=Seg1389.12/GoldUCD/mRNA.D3Y31 product="ADP-ribosylation factor-like protein 16" protein_id=Seg1389.12/GoldUCD/D3Y31